MLLIRSGSMIVLIGMLFLGFSPDTLPHRLISRRQHHSLDACTRSVLNWHSC